MHFCSIMHSKCLTKKTIYHRNCAKILANGLILRPKIWRCSEVNVSRPGKRQRKHYGSQNIKVDTTLFCSFVFFTGGVVWRSAWACRHLQPDHWKTIRCIQREHRPEQYKKLAIGIGKEIEKWAICTYLYMISVVIFWRKALFPLRTYSPKLPLSNSTGRLVRQVTLQKSGDHANADQQWNHSAWTLQRITDLPGKCPRSSRFYPEIS